jgi:hypothetical protein
VAAIWELGTTTSMKHKKTIKALLEQWIKAVWNGISPEFTVKGMSYDTIEQMTVQKI